MSCLLSVPHVEQCAIEEFLAMLGTRMKRDLIASTEKNPVPDTLRPCKSPEHTTAAPNVYFQGNCIRVVRAHFERRKHLFGTLAYRFPI